MSPRRAPEPEPPADIPVERINGRLCRIIGGNALLATPPYEVSAHPMTGGKQAIHDYWDRLARIEAGKGQMRVAEWAATESTDALRPDALDYPTLSAFRGAMRRWRDRESVQRI